MQSSESGPYDVTVMTQNVYFGTDLKPVYAARSSSDLFEAVLSVWEEVQASKIPQRAARIAHEIAAGKPDLVGLQEIAQWSTGSFGAMSVRYDLLESILRSLRDEGFFYVPIAIRVDLNQVAPLDKAENLLQFTDRHAVLLKIDSDFGRIQPYNAQAETFSTLLQVSNFVAGSMKVLRSWIAVDAIVGDRKFRLIETHVESLDEAVQLAQARELVAGPANTSLPVVMMGDFNSNANRQTSVPDYTSTYPELITAGFHDVWASTNPDDPGNTCCHARDLLNSTSELNRRIDLFLTRGTITPNSAELVGDGPAFRLTSGRWASDHAGVIAKLRIA
jgi:endonuclease/exonuclease/phosphatase family metal-dependent hydrolase